jgi:hypothetical protein
VPAPSGFDGVHEKLIHSESRGMRMSMRDGSLIITNLFLKSTMSIACIDHIEQHR